MFIHSYRSIYIYILSNLAHLSTSKPLNLPKRQSDFCLALGPIPSHTTALAAQRWHCAQVHPTGLVEPDDPEAKIKFLAAEALRGVGGLVINAEGQRFCNELGRRDYVTGEMWKSKARMGDERDDRGAVDQ